MSAPAQPTPATGFLFKELQHDGQTYRYAEYVPRNYSSDKKWPLIVFLNGAGECGTDGSKHLAVGLATAIMVAPKRWPFIVLFPQKQDVHNQWEQHDAVVMDMVRRARSDYSIDASRLYLTGLSQGGHGTWAIGSLHPRLWAAIAPVCGYGRPEEIAPTLKAMPIWTFHGDADTAVRLVESEDLVAAVKAVGGDAILTVYPGVGHNSWDKAYRDEDLPAWLLSHRRDDPGE